MGHKASLDDVDSSTDTIKNPGLIDFMINDLFSLNLPKKKEEKNRRQFYIVY